MSARDPPRVSTPLGNKFQVRALPFVGLSISTDCPRPDKKPRLEDGRTIENLRVGILFPIGKGFESLEDFTQSSVDMHNFREDKQLLTREEVARQLNYDEYAKEIDDPNAMFQTTFCRTTPKLVAFLSQAIQGRGLLVFAQGDVHVLDQSGNCIETTQVLGAACANSLLEPEEWKGRIRKIQRGEQESEASFVQRLQLEKLTFELDCVCTGGGSFEATDGPSTRGVGKWLLRAINSFVHKFYVPEAEETSESSYLTLDPINRNAEEAWARLGFVPLYWFKKVANPECNEQLETPKIYGDACERLREEKQKRKEKKEREEKQKMEEEKEREEREKMRTPADPMELLRGNGVVEEI